MTVKKVAWLISILLFIVVFIGISFGEWVNGYFRKDGTYVPGYWRSSPNQNRWDNYGPSSNSYDTYNPYQRDYDNDGIPNYIDMDDDNDGVMDDFDKGQYNQDKGFW